MIGADFFALYDRFLLNWKGIDRRLLLMHYQIEPECRPNPNLADQLNLAAVTLDDIFDDR